MVVFVATMPSSPSVSAIGDRVDVLVGEVRRDLHEDGGLTLRRDAGDRVLHGGEQRTEPLDRLQIAEPRRVR